MTKVAIYAGSFDPITRGHEDLMQRSLEFVDRLVVAVATNVTKQPLFSAEERMELIRLAVGHEPRIEARQFDGLLVDFARQVGARLLIRGLRAVADFEYEYQMAGMNQQLDDEVETVFLMADVSLQPIASRLVKEIALFGGDISRFVSREVCELVEARVTTLGRRGDF